MEVFTGKAANSLRLSTNPAHVGVFISRQDVRSCKNVRKKYGGEASGRCESVVLLLLFYDPPTASDCFHSKRVFQPPAFCALVRRQKPEIPSQTGPIFTGGKKAANVLFFWIRELFRLFPESESFKRMSVREPLELLIQTVHWRWISCVINESKSVKILEEYPSWLKASETNLERFCPLVVELSNCNWIMSPSVITLIADHVNLKKNLEKV